MATPEQVKDFLSVVKSHGIKELDTALVYNKGKSEELLAAANAKSDFAISTKAPGFSPGSLSEQAILANSDSSHKNLQQDKVDIYYIHGPDAATPLEEQCRAFGKLYSQGRFERFGVSNLSPAQVQEIYDICKKEGYPPPTVYQGGYNPIYRMPETVLLPTLRKLGIAYYIFSPLGGGILAKPIEEVMKPKAGTRFHEMTVFGDLYLREPTIEALKKMSSLCDDNKISMMEATMRWLMHHSPLEEQDAIVLGASSKEQIDATLSACEQGPLPKSMVDGWEEVWKSILDSGNFAKMPGM